MNDSNAKIEMMLERMAAHVLQHGLARASLRPLAKAAGTSDRMLIYHFGSKDGLIAAILTALADRLTTSLDTALPPGRTAGRAESLRLVMSFLRRPEASAFSHIWFDILAESKRGNPVYQDTGAKILDGFTEWIAARLPEDDPDPMLAASQLLCLIEGAVVLDAAGRADAVEGALASIEGLFALEP